MSRSDPVTTVREIQHAGVKTSLRSYTWTSLKMPSQYVARGPWRLHSDADNLGTTQFIQPPKGDVVGR